MIRHPAPLFFCPAACGDLLPLTCANLRFFCACRAPRGAYRIAPAFAASSKKIVKAGSTLRRPLLFPGESGETYPGVVSFWHATPVTQTEMPATRCGAGLPPRACHAICADSRLTTACLPDTRCHSSWTSLSPWRLCLKSSARLRRSTRETWHPPTAYATSGAAASR